MDLRRLIVHPPVCPVWAGHHTQTSCCAIHDEADSTALHWGGSLGNCADRDASRFKYSLEFFKK